METIKITRYYVFWEGDNEYHFPTIDEAIDFARFWKAPLTVFYK